MVFQKFVPCPFSKLKLTRKVLLAFSPSSLLIKPYLFLFYVSFNHIYVRAMSAYLLPTEAR